MAVESHDGSVYGVVLTAAGSANTKGSWVTVYTLTAAATGFWISIDQLTAGGFSIDIGTGGSPAVVVPDILTQGSAETGPLGRLWIPMALASGTQVSARCQSTVISGTIGIRMQFVSGSFTRVGLTSATNYGFVAATTTGLSFDPGATPNTDTAWTELSASTSALITDLVILASKLNSGATALPLFLIDIGTGAAGSETVLIPNIRVRKGVTFNAAAPWAFTFRNVDIPAATRLVARLQCNSGTAGERLLELVAIGLN